MCWKDIVHICMCIYACVCEYMPTYVNVILWLIMKITLFRLFVIESESRSVVSDSLLPHGLYSPWNSPGKNTGVDSLSLLQGIFPTQGSNWGLLHYIQILYQLSHKGRLWILDWVAYPFSRGSYRPRNRTGVSCTAGGFFTNWAISGEPFKSSELQLLK